MKRLLQILTPIAFSTLALGCNLGGSDSGGSSPIPEDRYASELAVLVCGFIHSQCMCDMPTDPDEQTCVDNRTSQHQSAMDAANAAGLTYDADCAGKTYAEAQSIACKTSSEIGSSYNCSAWCSLYHGDVAAGQPCNYDGGYGNCAKGLYCDGETSTCVDYCDVFQPEDLLGQGEACDIEGPACDYNNDLFCSSMTMTCEVAPGVGEACPEYYCASGAQCDSNTMTCVAYDEDPIVCF